MFCFFGPSVDGSRNKRKLNIPLNGSLNDSPSQPSYWQGFGPHGSMLLIVEKTNTQVRNETLDEIVKEMEHLAIVFGVDTVHTFMALIRSMKE
jgi:hypothetical protein